MVESVARGAGFQLENGTESQILVSVWDMGGRSDREAVERNRTVESLRLASWFESPLACGLTARILQSADKTKLTRKGCGSHPFRGADVFVSNYSAIRTP